MSELEPEPEENTDVKATNAAHLIANEQYLVEHPRAIEDLDKAEVMAYASAPQEEHVAGDKRLMINAAMQIGENEKYIDKEGNMDGATPKQVVEMAMERMKISRDAADSNTDKAAEIYDKVKNSEQKLTSSEQENANRVEDPDKAEVMAYASNPAEESIIDYRGRAIDAATQLGSNEKYIDREGNTSGVTPEKAAEIMLNGIEDARKRADSNANKAAKIYDEVKKF